MARRTASIVTVLALAAGLAGSGQLTGSPALADGDPASDTLLGENVFYPYQPPVSAGVQQTLNAETMAAKAAGFPIKVALIAAPVDLGVIPALFGKPQQYADFLDQEISFQGKQPLLVVMAAGYGTQGLSSLATAAVAGLRPPAGTSSTALAQAAITAVARLAAATGHPVKNVPGLSGSGSSGSSLPLIVALVLTVLVVAGALVVLRRRQTVRPDT